MPQRTPAPNDAATPRSASAPGRDAAVAAALGLARMGAEIATVPAGPGHRRALAAAFAGADGAYLMTPQIDPQEDAELALGKELADAAVEAGKRVG